MASWAAPKEAKVGPACRAGPRGTGVPPVDHLQMPDPRRVSQGALRDPGLWSETASQLGERRLAVGDASYNFEAHST